MTCSYETVSALTTTYSTQTHVFHLENYFHHQEKINVMAAVQEQKLLFLSHA